MDTNRASAYAISDLQLARKSPLLRHASQWLTTACTNAPARLPVTVGEAAAVSLTVAAAPGPDVYESPQPPRPQLLQLQVKGNDAAVVAAVRTTTGAVATAASAPAP